MGEKESGEKEEEYYETNNVMSKGKKIVIFDRCNKRKGKIERIFCPAFTDFLRIIRCEEPVYKGIKSHTALALKAYRKNKAIKRKYDFFKYRLKTLCVKGRTIKMNAEPSVWRQTWQKR